MLQKKAESGGTMELCVLGEYLIDFTPSGKNPNGLPLYAQNPGGAPVNVACACAKLGVSAGVITRISRDPFGCFLFDYLRELGSVDMRGVVRGGEPTGLAFVTLDASGDRDFVFFREGCADSMLRREDVDLSLLEECSVFHFSSVSLVSPVSREATLFAAAKAREQGKTVSFDINYRPFLWKSEEDAVREVAEAIGYADIVKASEEEAAVFGGLIRDCGAVIVLTTFGADGSAFETAAERGRVPSFPVNAVDTTGAGDCFMGAFLSRFIRSGKKAGEMEGRELTSMLEYANAAGALCATGYGAIAPQPNPEDVERLLESR